LERKANDYLKLQYQVNLRPISEEDGGGWLAEIPDLSGCYSDGETPGEALNNIMEAKETWIKTALKRGQEIPMPKVSLDDEEYSGKFTLRLPKSLHRDLAISAAKEDISLNSYILSLLSYNFGKNQYNKINFYGKQTHVAEKKSKKKSIKEKYNISLANIELYSINGQQLISDKNKRNELIRNNSIDVHEINGNIIKLKLTEKLFFKPDGPFKLDIDGEYKLFCVNGFAP
jgi:antitoxin HicB